MILANLQELESWPMCICWNLLVAGATILFMYAIAVGEARGIVPIAAKYWDIEKRNKKDSVNIAGQKKAKRPAVKMKTNEKNVLLKKRWATQLPTPLLP